ncbi:MAG: [FeFe] hydrogenase H-cluster radical SAM maturase HydE [Bacteroidales bacterium]|nr:[FeFe] hydrogenase H-cluster radical SAM maturase HydE [Bacteroidales bacterium]
MLTVHDVREILLNRDYSHSTLTALLETNGEALQTLFDEAEAYRRNVSGTRVYFRGLVELSNICAKDCFYCGVRCSNRSVQRYTLSLEEVVEAARFAHRNGFASMVLQSGERADKRFVDMVAELLQAIHIATRGELHITLSMGEQSRETFQRWYDLGAHRYLLRIEASVPDLYLRLHPEDGKHRYEHRIESLHLLKDIGYQTGTGVMIGLPFQDTAHLASDLLFFRELDIDMVGMGPYIEHDQTPLFQYRHLIPSTEERFWLSMKMVAILRLMMPDINIAATTAMQAIREGGREFALKVGANVVMPNLTPTRYRENYLLYKDKPGTAQDAEDTTENLTRMIHAARLEVALGEWGDSTHYQKRLIQ